MGRLLALEEADRLSGLTEEPGSGLTDRLRREHRLDEARAEALLQATREPDNCEAQWRAARALADAALQAGDEEAFAVSALRGLGYARRATEIEADNPDCQAQMAYLLGLTTHLRPMSERPAHARATIEAAQRALSLRADDPTAHLTLGTVHLRLATLPWIAHVMARDIPDGSLEQAESHLRRAVQSEPSLEIRLALAKVLLAADHTEEARELLKEASSTPLRFPRDPLFRLAILTLFESQR